MFLFCFRDSFSVEWYESGESLKSKRIALHCKEEKSAMSQLTFLGRAAESRAV